MVRALSQFPAKTLEYVGNEKRSVPFAEAQGAFQEHQSILIC